MPVDPASTTPPTRRAVVAAASGAGLAAVLTACGSDSDSDKASGSPSSDAPASASDAPTTKGMDGIDLGKTSDIPVGGGKIYADHKVVVTQPTEGEFKGFSSVCTHTGCALTEVADGTINCPCHGSKFKVADGSVAQGPATKPLPAENVMAADGVVMIMN
jgi:Rieske Fe-S protein